MKKKRFLVALAAVAILIPLLVGCDAFGTGAPPPATSGIPASIPQLEGRMSSLESRVSSVEGKITDTSTLQTDLEQLRTDYDAFVATFTEEGGTITELALTVAELNDRIAALEKQFDEEEEENGGATGETCKWYKNIYNINHLDKIKSTDIAAYVSKGMAQVDADKMEGKHHITSPISYSFSPSKIQEADDYTVYIDIENNTLTRITDLWLEVAFTPRTGSRVTVDEDEVYLDTVYSPFYVWEVEVPTRPEGSCRRIIFSTGKDIDVPAGTVSDGVFIPGLTQLRLVFTLAYE